MKHLKLFEAFEDIDSICKRYNITNYTINSDGTVDVEGDVNLRQVLVDCLFHDDCFWGLTKLPLKFGKVTGDFDCSRNQLISLDGAPKEVGGDFDCSYNQLTTLEGGPSHVDGGFFYCNNNQLITLEGGPREVGGYFDCGDNPIHSIYKLFPYYKAFMDSLDYNYFRGTNIVKIRFKEACEEAGIRMPEKIEGYNYI